MKLRPLIARWGDLVLAVGIAAAYAIEVAGYPRAHLPAAALLAAATGLVLAGRRRVPLVVFVLMIGGTVGVIAEAPLFEGHSVFLSLAFMLALYSVGRHTHGIEAWLGAPAVVVAVVMLEVSSQDLSPSGIVFYLLFAGLPWGAGLAIRLRIERVRDLQARNAALAEQARRAVADERARIARELHDVVSHAIAVTVLQARGSRRLVGRDDAAVRQALTAIEGTNTAALADMRRLLSLLRNTEDIENTEEADSALEPLPTLDRLGDLIEQVRAAGVPVDLAVDGERLPVTPGIDLSAYRIVQEALTNVLKHSGPGARASVRVHYDIDDLRIEVDSSSARPPGSTGPAGPGGPAGTGGHGLAGIRERVMVTGGTVQAGPTGGGWRVHASMPYLARDRRVADPS
ncbi:sensor histidine kinase [uncultured Amnibacterium sp.]|uniref:sensor histidine kinase n=1 Tax=uncultured Amnibacterium sp. TaxID=1631851 RepID=UPI0035CC839E